MIIEEATKYVKPESWSVKILQHCNLNIKLETSELQNFGKKKKQPERKGFLNVQL